jgi:hypothetical protein
LVIFNFRKINIKLYVNVIQISNLFKINFCTLGLPNTFGSEPFLALICCKRSAAPLIASSETMGADPIVSSSFVD